MGLFVGVDRSCFEVVGVPPVPLKILTFISGIDFAKCYARRVEGELDGVPVPLLGIEDLKANKLASGRLKERLDLEHLP
jgi:hypothetical protein